MLGFLPNFQEEQRTLIKEVGLLQHRVKSSSHDELVLWAESLVS